MATAVRRAGGAFGKVSESQNNLRDGVGDDTSPRAECPCRVAGLLAHGVTRPHIASLRMDEVPMSGPERPASPSRRFPVPQRTFARRLRRMGAVGGFVKGGRFVEEEASNPADHDATPVAFPARSRPASIAPCNRLAALNLSPMANPDRSTVAGSAAIRMPDLGPSVTFPIIPPDRHDKGEPSNIR
ncbi:hypothetical protein SAMN03159448_04547 [Sinorhizobium sp. NFACC03]|nr:hypothetical protein SAMN03159448_04547 [Sinorhizobium sp. NFACC03]